MTRGPRSLSRGFTLIEILVAMTLSLLIIAGIGQIYLAAKRSYEIQTNLAQIQDVGRYVTDVLTKEIHMAGYWDLMNINDPAATINNKRDPAPDSCHSGNSDWGRMVRDGIFGLDNTDPAAGIPAYDCISSWERGDALIVRYADPVQIPTTGPFTATRLYIQTSPTVSTLTLGDPSGSPSPGPIFSIHAVVAHAYYVANSTPRECGNVPVFARETLTSSGAPVRESLVNGVEQLQFQYGIDTAITAMNPAGDGSVNQYVDADQITCVGGAPCWNQVRAVRFWALVRADCQEAGYTDTTTYQLGDFPYPTNDHYRRALYSSTVALRN